MFCKNCGSQIDDGVDFCPICGAKVNSAVTTEGFIAQDVSASGKSCMIWGIVAAALAELGLLGLIFAIVAKGKVKKHINAGYPMTGMAKAGKILSNIALALSIVMTVIWLIYIIIIIFAFILAETAFIA